MIAVFGALRKFIWPTGTLATKQTIGISPVVLVLPWNPGYNAMK